MAIPSVDAGSASTPNMTMPLSVVQLGIPSFMVTKIVAAVAGACVAGGAGDATGPGIAIAGACVAKGAKDVARPSPAAGSTDNSASSSSLSYRDPIICKSAIAQDGMVASAGDAAGQLSSCSQNGSHPLR